MKRTGSRVWILTILGLLLCGGLAMGSLAPPPADPGHWALGDGGTAHLADNISSAKTYRVSLGAGEVVVTVEVRDANNNVINTVELTPRGSSVDVGVPQGGDLLVRDTNPNNGKGASGTYDTV